MLDCSKLIRSSGGASITSFCVSESYETTEPLWVVSSCPIKNVPSTSLRIRFVFNETSGATEYLNPSSVTLISVTLPISVVFATRFAFAPFSVMILRFGSEV